MEASIEQFWSMFLGRRVRIPQITMPIKKFAATTTEKLYSFREIFSIQTNIVTLLPKQIHFVFVLIEWHRPLFAEKKRVGVFGLRLGYIKRLRMNRMCGCIRNHFIRHTIPYHTTSRHIVLYRLDMLYWRWNVACGRWFLL